MNVPEKESNESLLIESSLQLCHQVRLVVLEKYPSVWLYVYPKNQQTQSAFLTVSNGFGGKLQKSLLEEVAKFAKEQHLKLKN